MKIIDLVKVLNIKAETNPDLEVSALVFEIPDGKVVFANMVSVDKKAAAGLIGTIKMLAK